MRESACPDPDTIPDRLRNRREFLQLLGRGLGYAALASTLPACGGGSDPLTPAPTEVIAAASAEYTVLVHTEFGWAPKGHRGNTRTPKYLNTQRA